MALSQKPIKQAYERQPGAVKQWLDEQYPKVAKRARTEGGEIHWGDETALINHNILKPPFRVFEQQCVKPSSRFNGWPVGVPCPRFATYLAINHA